MKRNFYNALSQRKRLLLLLLVFSIIPIVVVGLFAYFITTGAIEDMAVESSSEMIDRVSNDVDSLFKDAIGIGDMIADDMDIQAILRNEYDSIAQMYSLDLKGDTRLNFLPSYKQEIYGVYVIGQNGNKHKSRFASFQEGDLREASWYRQILDADAPVWFGTHVGSFAVVTVDDELVSCGMQIIDKASGGKSGAILIDLDIETLGKMLGSRLGKNGGMFIVDNSGSLVASADNSSRIPKDLLDAAQNSKDVRKIGEMNVSNQRTHIVFQKKLSTNDWYLIGVIPKSELMVRGIFLGVLIILCCIVMAVFSIVLSIRVSSLFVRPLNELKATMKRVEEGDLNVQLQTDREDEIGQLSNGFNLMVNNIKELMDNVIEEQKKLRKAEFSALQAQINPHFLYNTLDSIVWLARKGAYSEIVDMVTALTSLFRISLSKGMEIITLRNEISHVQSYLVVQSLRYQDKFDYEIDMPAALNGALTLKLLLQPIVENAIYHGIKQKREKGRIAIKVAQMGENIQIEVADTGAGMTAEELDRVRQGIESQKARSSGSYGLKNVNERIKIYFGSEYGLDIFSAKNKGTTVRVTIPMRMEGE